MSEGFVGSWASLSPEQLIRRAQRDDDLVAFGELVRRLSAPLAAHARRLAAPGYGDDLLQETWLRAWRYRRTFAGRSSVLTWLHRILVTAATDPRLRPGPDLEIAAEELADTASEADLEVLLVADAVEAALAPLSPIEVQVLRSRLVDREDWASIGRALDLGSGYRARVLFTQTMRKLHARWRPEGLRGAAGRP